MPANISLPELPTRIQNLLEERQKHTEAVAHIDQILESISDALGVTTKTSRTPKAAKAPADSEAPATKGRKRRRSKFATSGEESILAFVKEHEDPTTQEIKKHWLDEGRGATADNALSLMVKARKLKRVPLGEGIRGSRFMLP